jgi:hypothetical protein
LNKDITHAELERIELETQKQHACVDWFKYREGKLTASNFGKILQRKSVPSDSFLKDVFNKSTRSSAAMDYGRKHEKDGKAKYLDTFPSRHIHDCGFVINNEFNFLGASPDGKICDNGDTGLVEVKCPYSARNMEIEEACELPGFYLINDGNKISLNKRHAYYAQVQGQLMITGCEFCDFVVYTQKDIFVERITTDVDFMRNMLITLCKFMDQYGC